MTVNFASHAARRRKVVDVSSMKVGILAGGYGTRMAEETEVRPKPMVEILSLIHI